MSQTLKVPEDLRASASRLRSIIGVAAALLWVLLFLERFGEPAASLLMRGLDIATLRDLGGRSIEACPQALYLLALGGIRQALGAIARGELFGPTLTRMLARVGGMFAAGAFAAVFLVPSLQRALGAGPPYWIALDISALALGTTGLALTVIARVLRQARDLERELDEIF